MKFDQELKIQAYLDGDLSPRESRQVEAWLATDRAAASLDAESALSTAVSAALAALERQSFGDRIAQALEQTNPTPKRKKTP